MKFRGVAFVRFHFQSDALAAVAALKDQVGCCIRARARLRSLETQFGAGCRSLTITTTKPRTWKCVRCAAFGGLRGVLRLMVAMWNWRSSSASAHCGRHSPRQGRQRRGRLHAPQRLVGQPPQCRRRPVVVQPDSQPCERGLRWVAEAWRSASAQL